MHRGSAASASSFSHSRRSSAVYGSSGTTAARITYTPRELTWDRPSSNTVLNKCLENPRVRTLFGQFLAKEHSVEGLLFLEHCVAFFQAPTLDGFRIMASAFVRPGSACEVNISEPARKAFDGAQTLDDARAAVALAETDIHRLLGDPLKRFQNDQVFLDFLATQEGAALFPELRM